MFNLYFLITMLEKKDPVTLLKTGTTKTLRREHHEHSGIKTRIAQAFTHPTMKLGLLSPKAHQKRSFTGQGALPAGLTPTGNSKLKN